jgi:FAD/FMN-containing dehydrogenase
LPRNETELQDGLKIYKQLAAKAVKFGGSISAEHGIGKLKIKFLEQMYSPEQINEMKAVKLTIDPDFLLNPGNIFAIDKDLQLQ